MKDSFGVTNHSLQVEVGGDLTGSHYSSHKFEW
jgi:hypothetical protein